MANTAHYFRWVMMTTDPVTEDEMTKAATPARGMDESGQGQRRAIAEAIARPLGGPTRYKQLL
jgi:hypothetical protein